MKRGFTLIELLLFVAIFTIVIIAFITVLVSFTTIQSNQSAVSAVNQESQYLLQQIQYYVSSARLVDMTQDVATGTLTLREFNASLDYTSITLSGGTVYLQQGTYGNLQALTSNDVTVSGLTFTRHYNLNASSSALGTDSVSFSFTMSATSTNNQVYSQSFQSSVAVLNPVPKIVLLQQAGIGARGPGGGGGTSTFSLTYPMSNETGSLLIAAVFNAASIPALSVTDSAGNTWNEVASTVTPAFYTALGGFEYIENLSIFAAVNAINSSNTVTAIFGIPTSTYNYGNNGFFIYEYRGASTSSSFDASSGQGIASSSTGLASSGFANPTSTIELLFSVAYGAAGAGNGFTVEITSSTYPAYYFTGAYAAMEDATQYITGPVAATWQTAYAVLLATFK